jgi:hypothetical protein
MIANPWENKQTLKDQMFVEEFATRICLEYLDIPELYTFSEQGNLFFEILTSNDNVTLFKYRSI